ncbi:hypothetical protein T4B_12470 [Trichinella pseudospiralis]|uniref:Uncharacterized protein n=2 Tax=Trichinella pseudospiralis TaxID=6337 RepID=A0A0V0Y1M7_TRIPS|nr:hypothetical protein T4E_2827 [Trichinella pseudospiralis]KRY71705.1 hypothetical protein T4A_4994 [Trichinella pseudospiralis]KRY90961.1 hypothetical protein T4D_16421 [Trichinella pseudospiralis]KRZ27960.1 hypothetical protein T4B_12470 [Trichinella pseudospiralis]KRZ42376.1 hypothetical protein T4C_4553 [Trichinella pseudospiralis]
MGVHECGPSGAELYRSELAHLPPLCLGATIEGLGQIKPGASEGSLCSTERSMASGTPRG